MMLQRMEASSVAALYSVWTAKAESIRAAPPSSTDSIKQTKNSMTVFPLEGAAGAVSHFDRDTLSHDESL